MIYMITITSTKCSFLSAAGELELSPRRDSDSASEKFIVIYAAGTFTRPAVAAAAKRTVEKFASRGKLERARIIDQELSFAISLGSTLLSLLAFHNVP